MNRKKLILASAVVAFYGLTAPCVPTARAEDVKDGPTVNSRVASDPHDQKNELRGIQKLFGEAVNKAANGKGAQALSGLFVAQTDEGHALRDGGPASGSGSVVVKPAPSRGVEVTPAPSGGVNVTPAPANGVVVTPAPAAPQDTAADDRIARQFADAWHAKYREDFRIGDAADVFADLTPDDLRPSRRDVGLKLTPSTKQPDTPPPPAAPTIPPGSPATNPNNQRTAAGTAIPRTDPESLKPLSERMVVRIPAVGNTNAFEVHVTRVGPTEFRFASTGEVENARLQRDIDRHLDSMTTDRDKWPDDVHQARRFVAQHLLLAIAEYQANGAVVVPAGEKVIVKPSGGTTVVTPPANGR